MTDYDPATYGERVAGVYDAWHGRRADTLAAVELLVELAGAGPVLELGIGTGRIAIPLVRRGLEVHGIEASPAMVAQLRAKPGGSEIPVTIGDVADVRLDKQFSLIFAAFNTIFFLESQEHQVRCFRNAARHLEAGGALVIEASTPGMIAYEHGQRISLIRAGPAGVTLNVARHDPVEQRIAIQRATIRDGAVGLVPVPMRYAWPAELDLMARLADLNLQQRWADWRRRPFHEGSAWHVSVYRPGEA